MAVVIRNWKVPPFLTRFSIRKIRMLNFSTLSTSVKYSTLRLDAICYTHWYFSLWMSVGTGTLELLSENDW
jgi:hypothetical protein